MAKPIRVYADTSVFGGAFDRKFSEASQEFFRQVRAGGFRLVLSPLIEEELQSGPQTVRALFLEMTKWGVATVVTPEASLLQQAYLEAGIVGETCEVDALHVALATVAQCAVIVSWNFRHIVHFEKIPKYNAVNALNGFGRIEICSPSEVLAYEE
jgi:hypothetical protein